MYTFLTIGSVVMVRQSDKRMMIIGRNQRDKKTEKNYDYIACCFPEGVKESNKVFHFNQDDIIIVFSLGYLNIDELQLRKRLESEIGGKKE